ncbi:uncharacterized protein LOC144563790 isoform X2 [Carex rostrata]
MPSSRYGGKIPQNPDNARCPAPGVGANSSSNVRIVETSPGLGFPSNSAPAEPSPLRRSLRISEASSSSQSPQPAMHVVPTSSAEASLELGFEATSALPHLWSRFPRRNPRMSTGGILGNRGGKFLLVPKSVIGESESKKKRGRPPKGIRIGGNDGDESVARRSPAQPNRIEILNDVVVIEDEEEEEVRGDSNVANNDGLTVNKFTGEEFVNVRSTSRGIDKGKGILNEEFARELSYKDKGKKIIIENLDAEYVKVSDSDSDELDELLMEGAANMFSLSQSSPKRMKPMPGDITIIRHNRRREAQKNKAIELAPNFAHFTNEKGEETMKDDEPLPNGPGPFSTAMKIIKERVVGVTVSWTPSNEGTNGLFGMKKPTLRELSLKALAKNADEIESLMGIPCAMRCQLSLMLCQSRKMNMHHLANLMEDSVTELRLSDCSWANEENFEDAFGKFDKSNLEVLQLDRCGRCMPDYVVFSTLACGQNKLPSLTKLSLKGAYSLSDQAVAAIVSSAPLLNSLNLCQCSLLTSEGIINVLDKQALLLKELYIDECQNISAMSILPSLKKVKCLEVLSMAGIPSVSNKFVHELIPVCGSTIFELNFAGCNKLTSSAIKIIGENCQHLSVLDIRNLTELKDSTIAHLANGCRAIQKLLLRKSSFSDEVIAAFVEASGTKLIELSLNSTKVSDQTAIAISTQCCGTLQKLDLSFCRNMSEKALGLIVDSCFSLKTLKLFGCTQSYPKEDLDLCRGLQFPQHHKA